MPNWCGNILTVTGDPEKVTEFVEQMKGVEFDEDGTPKGEVALDFEAVMPMPRVLKGRKSPSDDGSITWYDWQTEHWGVKWGSCNSHIDSQEDGKVVYRYDTPWGPAINWIETLISYYPWLSFLAEWEECGMGFAGETAGEDGRRGPIKEWEVRWDDELGDVVPVE